MVSHTPPHATTLVNFMLKMDDKSAEFDGQITSAHRVARDCYGTTARNKTDTRVWFFCVPFFHLVGLVFVSASEATHKIKRVMERRA